MRSSKWLLLLLLGSIVLPGFAHAADPVAAAAKRRHALLVGCTTYDHHPDLSLEGPANDVVLMRQTLIERLDFSPERIRTLSESPDAVGRPTRANIEAQFKRLAAEVRPGDQVVVLLGGHGSQQPDQDHDSAVDPEPDGQDEIFLPCDVKGWAGGTVANAIVDDELGRWTRAIAGQGVFVWMIFDSCHSGTALRELKLGGKDSDPFKVRNVLPAGLGIPLTPPSSTFASSGMRGMALDNRPTRARSLPGSGVGENASSAPLDQLGADLPIVALYASQSYETEKECKLPRGSPHAQWRGLLAYSVCQILQQGPLPSYRELQQAIVAQYRKWNFNDPTPLVEGKDIDHVILNDTSRPVRFQLGDKTNAGWKLEAGLLHGLSEHSVLAVFAPRSVDDPAAGESNRSGGEAILGYVRVVSSDVSQSTVVPCDYAGVPATSELPEHGLCKLEYRDLGNMRLRVAVDRVGHETDSVLDRIAGQLAAAQKQPDALFELVPELGQAHWAVQWREGSYLLLPADQAPVAGSLPADVIRIEIPTPPNAERLATALNRAARVRNLLELCEPETADRSAGDSVTEFDVRFEMLALNNKFDRKGVPIALDRPVHLRPGQWVAFRISNRGVAAIDVTLLFVDSQLAIEPVFPEKSTSGNNRIQGGTSFVSMPAEILATTTGHEQLVAIAVKAQGGPTDFLFLTQPNLKQAMQQRGFDDGSPLARLLKTANYRDGIARGLAVADMSQYCVRSIPWNVASGKQPTP